MNSKKTSSLKDRLQQLRVSEPLRLPKTPPQFEVPKINKGEQLEVPLREAPQVGDSQVRATPSEHAYTGAPKGKIPQIENAPIHDTQSEVPRDRGAQASQGAPSMPLKDQPMHSEVTRKELVHYKVVRNEAAQVDKDGTNVSEQKSDRIRGFFKLSHSVFSHRTVQNLSGDCFRLFLWLSSRAWRFPDSNGTVRASVAYISLHTGMGHATISRGLKTLKEEKLISIVEVNFRQGNLWHISSLIVGNADSENDPFDFEPTQNEGPQKGNKGASKRAASYLKMDANPPQIEEQIRSIKKQENLLESDAEVSQFEEAVSEFESKLSAELRDKIIQDFVTREFQLGILPPRRVIKSLAAHDWFSQQSSSTFSNAS